MRSLSRALIALCLLLALCVVPSAHATGSPPAAYTSARYFPLEWHLSVIHAPEAWAQGATGFSHVRKVAVRVCVIDTGAARISPLAHAAVASYSSMAPITLTTPPPYSPDQPIVYHASPFVDPIGHGTFTSVEAVGRGADYVGVAPAAALMVARVFDQDGSTDDKNVIRAYYWCVNNGADIVSMSLGGSGYDPDFLAVLRYGALHGVLCVAAAGNDGAEETVYPASYPQCLRVTATDQNNLVTPWSSYGPDVAIAAPGSSVYGYVPTARNLIGARGPTTLSGTSMATPIVAGALALLLSAGLAPQDAVSALLAGAAIPKDALTTGGQTAELWGAGLVNVAASLRWAHAQHLSFGYVGPRAWAHINAPLSVEQDTGSSSLPIPSYKPISAAGPM